MDQARYEKFLKAHFRSVYSWCEEHYDGEPQAAIAAQRIVLDLYRLDLKLRR